MLEVLFHVQVAVPEEVRSVNSTTRLHCLLKCTICRLPASLSLIARLHFPLTVPHPQFHIDRQALECFLEHTLCFLSCCMSDIVVRQLPPVAKALRELLQELAIHVSAEIWRLVAFNMLDEFEPAIEEERVGLNEGTEALFVLFFLSFEVICEVLGKNGSHNSA